MRVALDTNVLVRVVVDDDGQQADRALEAISAADRLLVSTVVLCEFVWVLRSRYRLSPTEIALATRQIVRDSKVELDRPAAEAGLAALETGGDFADGVIAYEARRDGADRLITFDRTFAGSSQAPLVTLLS